MFGRPPPPPPTFPAIALQIQPEHTKGLVMEKNLYQPQL
jgi:hypothetical protein